jgi:hypothetical protein
MNLQKNNYPIINKSVLFTYESIQYNKKSIESFQFFKLFPFVSKPVF